MFMSCDPAAPARHAAILAELAEIGMAMARGLREEFEAAETPEAKARSMATFPKIARAVRQCLALESKLTTDARREAAEVKGEERRELALRIRRRKVKAAIWVQRAICNDTPDDGDLIGERMEDLAERLNENLLDADFADRPFHEVIGQLCEGLGLDPTRVLGEEPEDDEPEDQDDEPEDDVSGRSPPDPYWNENDYVVDDG